MSGRPGGDGAGFTGYQSLTISNGSFTGGTGFTGEGGFGLHISGGATPANVSGGTFSGDGSGGSLHVNGTGVVNLSGGQFNALMLQDDGSVVNVSGGSTYSAPSSTGRWDLHESSQVNVTGGNLSSVSFNLFDNAHANVSSGTVGQLNLNNTLTATISGGILHDEITLLDNSSLNWTGGVASFSSPRFTWEARRC